MAKTYIKELQEKIETLEDGFDMKAIELSLLENDMQDNLRPNIIKLQLIKYLLEMLMEVNQYEQKNKSNAKVKASKVRLKNMLDLICELSGIGDRLQSLKLFNSELVGKIQLLRIENSDLRKELKGVEDAHNYKTT